MKRRFGLFYWRLPLGGEKVRWWANEGEMKVKSLSLTLVDSKLKIHRENLENYITWCHWIWGQAIRQLFISPSCGTYIQTSSWWDSSLTLSVWENLSIRLILCVHRCRVHTYTYIHWTLLQSLKKDVQQNSFVGFLLIIWNVGIITFGWY